MTREHWCTHNLLGLGSFGHGALPKVHDAAQELNILHTILTEGVAGFNRGTTAGEPMPSRDGILNVSPLPQEIKNATGFVGEQQIAEVNRPNWEGSAHRMIDRVIAAHQHAGLVDGQTVWFQSIKSGHTKPAEEALEDLHIRLPRQFVLAASVIPDETYLRDALHADPFLFVRLKDRGIIETTVLTDNLSPLALRFGLQKQDQFFSKGLVTLMAAQPHFRKQRGFGDIAHALGLYGAWVGAAFASRNLVGGTEVPWWVPVRKAFGYSERGTGDLGDILIAAKEAALEVLTDPQAQAIEEPISPKKQAFLAFTVPLKLNDSRWQPLSAEIKHWLTREFPWVTPVFASGSGTPDPRFTSHYWLQASLFFPMPDIPRVVQQILSNQPLVRRSQGRTRANGEVSEPELISSTPPARVS